MKANPPCLGLSGASQTWHHVSSSEQLPIRNLDSSHVNTSHIYLWGGFNVQGRQNKSRRRRVGASFPWEACFFPIQLPTVKFNGRLCIVSDWSAFLSQPWNSYSLTQNDLGWRTGLFCLPYPSGGRAGLAEQSKSIVVGDAVHPNHVPPSAMQMLVFFWRCVQADEWTFSSGLHPTVISGNSGVMRPACAHRLSSPQPLEAALWLLIVFTLVNLLIPLVSAAKLWAAGSY